MPLVCIAHVVVGCWSPTLALAGLVARRSATQPAWRGGGMAWWWHGVGGVWRGGGMAWWRHAWWWYGVVVAWRVWRYMYGVVVAACGVGYRWCDVQVVVVPATLPTPLVSPAHHAYAASSCTCRHCKHTRTHRLQCRRNHLSVAVEAATATAARRRHAPHCTRSSLRYRCTLEARIARMACVACMACMAAAAGACTPGTVAVAVAAVATYQGIQ